MEDDPFDAYGRGEPPEGKERVGDGCWAAVSHVGFVDGTVEHEHLCGDDGERDVVC